MLVVVGGRPLAPRPGGPSRLSRSCEVMIPPSCPRPSLHVHVPRRIYRRAERTADNGLGDGGERLHEWVFPGPRAATSRPRDYRGEPPDLRRVHVDGAVVAGRGPSSRRTAGRRPSRWRADLHPQPPRRRRWARRLAAVHYVERPRRRCEMAKPAAGEKNGWSTGRSIASAPCAGLIDEIEIHLVPVLFGMGGGCSSTSASSSASSSGSACSRARAASRTCATAFCNSEVASFSATCNYRVALNRRKR